MRRLLNDRAPYLLIAPTVLLLLLFSITPLFVAFVMSFTNMDLAGIANFANVDWIGMTNYLEIFKDEVFLQALSNTVVYVVIGVPLVIALSLSIAIAINFGRGKVFEWFRVVFYMPSITNVVAVAVVWGFLFNPQYGLFNFILNTVGLPDVPWLQDPFVAKLSLILLALWRAVGINMIIFLAALQGIPRTYYEAAALDGANTFQQMFKITIPLLRYAIFFVTVTTLIGWIQFFEEPFIMTEGGPLNSTTSLALFIYQNGFQLSNFGYAAAGSVVLFVLIITVTLIQFRVQKNENPY
ncbi:sugar ABC transporter permease [Exiguobacterium sp. RIT452]|uniref:Sugar ABC transporter permease n=1 Tax=Exiguobacterium undae TaxID=169177 RepID=A0ABX2VD12_9BACL|nr:MULTISPECIES: sugar ABC transporter permease [Exiguobacterium]OAN15745.1 sugar ABC transporter permease [Exiguobacterium undae]RJP02288.1 sugar ABC transporter permease [Exiguobacterium sp. RIT452]